MSRRIRNIKPELIEDAVTAGLSDRAFRLFISCILLADDYGNLRADTRFLRGQIFWAREEVSQADVGQALAELLSLKPNDRPGLMTAYEVRGQLYAHVTNWERHQRITNAGKPQVPGTADSDHPQTGLAATRGDSRRTSSVPPEARGEHRSLPLGLAANLGGDPEVSRLGGGMEMELGREGGVGPARVHATPPTPVSESSHPNHVPTGTELSAIATAGRPPANPLPDQDHQPTPEELTSDELGAKDGKSKPDPRAGYARSYADGVARVTGARTPPTEKWSLDAIGKVLQLFAGGRRGDGLHAWIRDSAEAYARARPDDAEYGFPPERWERWHNGGRKAQQHRQIGPPVQPAAPSRPGWASKSDRGEDK